MKKFMFIMGLLFTTPIFAMETILPPEYIEQSISENIIPLEDSSQENIALTLHKQKLLEIQNQDIPLQGTLELSEKTLDTQFGTFELYKYNGIEFLYLPNKVLEYEPISWLVQKSRFNTLPTTLNFNMTLECMEIEQLKSFILTGQEGIFVPLSSLSGFLEINLISETQYKSTFKSNIVDDMIHILENTVIVNKTDIPINIDYVDITLDNNIFTENHHELDMTDLNQNYFLPSKSENFWEMVITNISQKGYSIFTIDKNYINDQQILLDSKIQYEEQIKEEQTLDEKQRWVQEQESIRLEQERLAAEEQKRIQLEQELKNLQMSQTTLESLFPPSIVTGTMLYNVGGFKAGQQVEVKFDERGKFYYVGPNATEVPWNSVYIPPDPYTQYKQATTEQIETYINLKGLKSNSNHLVWIDLYRQRMYVFENINGRWELFRNMLVSSGKNITPTIRGTFQATAYMPSFGWGKGYVCYDAVQFSGEYLIHSILYNDTGEYLLEGRGILGQRASDGCVRLSPEDADWFYHTIKLGTTIWVN
ncbi:hypothetical protein AN639_00490 [Candidatus Epulonipiscium fishelsonii]|uniref:Uncharacterized protein n=1 Tax=Candidatus Epulonipiscium fishelsonii TaxID=77094 RepID=A0ACC8XBK1_9FIRM|nr:hypothetical protein AN396_07150 [Epulopiscium sp. SCG-B11WGA-EpuloA1]ONI41279.1 hypothetical protein AN639_00490 [Epulopiscium sp. SCG-B05WGA-EpuloA1]